MINIIRCDWCTRHTTKMPRHGRRTRRHKCPHGHWCPRSDKMRQHDNHYPMGGPSCCDECRKAYWVREHARIERAGQRRADDEYFRSGTRYPGQ